MKNETILEIGDSIKKRSEEERRRGIGNMAIIRANCIFDKSDYSGLYWLTNVSTSVRPPLTRIRTFVYRRV